MADCFVLLFQCFMRPHISLEKFISAGSSTVSKGFDCVFSGPTDLNFQSIGLFESGFVPNAQKVPAGPF
jgi:hypothetical protein